MTQTLDGPVSPTPSRRFELKRIRFDRFSIEELDSVWYKPNKTKIQHKTSRNLSDCDNQLHETIRQTVHYGILEGVS